MTKDRFIFEKLCPEGCWHEWDVIEKPFKDGTRSVPVWKCSKCLKEEPEHRNPSNPTFTDWHGLGMLKESIESRFWNKVDKTSDKNGCWIWTGCIACGYGSFYSTKSVLAHRFSYELHKGKIPENLTIDHLCRNRRCVNPDHLEAVSMRINILRGNGVTANNARKVLCKRGHTLEPLTYPSSPENGRHCLVCHASYQRERRRIKREGGNNVTFI